MSFKILYRVPTIDEYEGTESFALIDPRMVSSITPTTATIGWDDKARTVTGSRVTISLDEQYIVPLPPTQVASMIDLHVEEPVNA